MNKKYKRVFSINNDLGYRNYTVRDLINLKGKKKLTQVRVTTVEEASAAQEAGIDFTQEEINNELLAIGAQEEEDGNPVLTDVNGFNMSVQPVPKTEVGSIVKRQAVAKDSKGIIILKGEPSFSASDQILIDELAFYITSNNLKA